MKKFTLAIIALISFVIPSQATHLMGGEITVQDLGARQYQVTLIAYRDTVGIPMTMNASLDYDGPNNQSFSSSMPYDSIISGNLLPMYPYGVEIYLFVDTVTLPSDGHWTISWKDCCRNGAIQNLSNPLGESMTLQTSILADSLTLNSSPFFLVPAAIFLPLNTSWQYNPLPFDPDGDSLHWSIDQPLKDVNTYCAGYVDPSSDTNNIFRIDPITGTISWTADMLGNFVASILVEQYRNGIWVGEIRRDMQFIVVNPSSGFPVWNNLSVLPIDSATQNYSFNLIAGKSFNLDMIATHTDSTKSVSLAAYSEIFRIPNSNATFTVTKSTQAKGTFNWQPTSADIRQKPYTVVFRASDGYFTDDKSVMLTVNTAIGINENNQIESLSLYPNPTSNHLYINYKGLSDQVINLEVYSLNGQKLFDEKDIKSYDGTNVYILETQDWNSGTYLLRIVNENGNAISKMLIKE